MQLPSDTAQPHIATINVNGRRYDVSVRVSYDGVEFIGRLWFTDQGPGPESIPDRGLLPGRTKEEVLAMARRLTENELIVRFRRAVANRRRYVGLRNVTNEILRKVRYLNQVAISMRAGLIDLDGAAQEMNMTEQQIHELVRRLRPSAGVEDARA